MPDIDVPALLSDPQVQLALAGAVVITILLALVPALRTLVRLAIGIALLAVLLLVLQQRAGVDPVLGRLASALDLDTQRVEGGELRVPMAADGHFWVRTTVNDVPVRMLIDSGATVTAISQATARSAGVETATGLAPVVLRTANGTVRPMMGTIAELRTGNIVARDLAIVSSPAFGDVNVIGMNFLSRLRSWRVEGRTLILVPNNPQPVAS